MTIRKVRVAGGDRRASRERRAPPRESDRATRRYATAVEFAAEGYAAVSREGRLLKVNAAMCALTGYSRDEMLHLAIADLEAVKSAAEVAAHSARIVASGNDNFESRWKRRDGTIFDVAVAVTYVGRGSDAFFCFVRDITSQKLADRSVRNLSRVVEQSPSLIVITDIKGNIEYVNPAFTRVTGYSLAEVSGKNPRVLHSGNKSPEEYAGLWKTITSGGTWRGEFHNRKKNGDLYWEDASISAVQDETGVITNFVAVKLDITERKQTEDRLRAAEERWKLALEGAGHFVWDENLIAGKVTFSAGYAETLGYGAEEYLTMIGDWMKRVHPEDLPAVLAARRAHLDGNTRSYSCERRMLCMDGSWKWMQTRGMVVARDKEGKPSRMLGTHTDITERKRAEAAIEHSANALRAAYRRLAHAQETERRKLAAELHDQVGQDLSALHLNLTVIGQDLPDESKAKVKARLDDSVAMTRQVSQQIRAVMGELRPPMLDDYGLFATLRWLAHQTSQRSGITCVLDWKEPAERLPGEIESALLRISQEALTNAVKYSKASWISIALTTAPPQVRLEITDNGAGFDLHELANGPQLSWGIITMRERAQSLGGRVEIESAPGMGTRILAEVPTA